MQPVLAASIEPLSKLSTLADSIQDLSNPTVNSSTAMSYEMQGLKQVIEDLSHEINEMKQHRSVSRFVRRNSHGHRDNICYYHEMFGLRARKFNKPCSFPKSKNL